VRAHLAGSSSSCKWEPQWPFLYPQIAKPTDTADRKAERAEWLVSNGVQCAKLKMQPSACHGCEDNPLGRETTGEGQEAIIKWWDDIKLIDRLHTAARLNLVRLQDISADELDLLGTFYWEFERAWRLQMRSST
jgi:hypothetical protein